MDLNPASFPPHLLKVVLVVLGLLALFLAIKFAHFILKTVFVLVGLALLGGAVWLIFFNTH
jgi:hypothetical protein